MADTPLITPWYRQPWPWLLMIAPAAAVVGGIFTWWLAAHTNHSLVVDDYYREGRAINQQLARDDEAARLGLSATLANAAGPGGATAGGGVVLELAGKPGEAGWPQALTLRLVHATEASLDAELRVAQEGIGRYVGAGVLPASGHWIVHLEDAGRHWRLITRADRFDAPLTLRADPLVAGGARP